MKYFDELYSKLKDSTNADSLDCLLNPKKYPPIIRTAPCTCSSDCQNECLKKCAFDALYISDNGVNINTELCTGCSACIESCDSKKLMATTDIIPALKAVKQSKSLTYAMIAPAFSGQFSKDVSTGMLRSAMQLLGFDGMVEVALFADILTLKEALEFNHNIKASNDFQLTSCCCPMWISMIRKQFHELLPHVPGSVSPMIACGRVIKALHPDAITVFIGPCLAKKQEARQPDISDAVDFVLTFEEMKNIFEAFKIDLHKMPDNDKPHSSSVGVIYARNGGVSEAVTETLKVLSPDKIIKTEKADGVINCKKLIKNILDGKIHANFYEGMGCNGGCCGGPKRLIDTETGTIHVNNYADKSEFKTPVDSPYVLELLKRIGIESIDELIGKPNMFDREFQ